ncbi:MAG: sulfate permease [Opitutaceae bacterium]|nr:sulfate permease [Opitutaceae bacterium]
MDWEARKRWLTAIEWMQAYDTDALKADLVAGAVVTMMLIPQSLAYALLAGMPPETGLYASMLPLFAYAIFGSSRTLSVGPVAIVSLMTMVALSNVVEPGSTDYISAAVTLALLSGTFLLIMGLFNFGFVANFLSHTVVSGFITASGIIIALSQVRHLLGVTANGDTLPKIVTSLFENIDQLHIVTLVLGIAVLGFLFWARTGIVKLFIHVGVTRENANLIAKGAPIVGVIATIILVSLFHLDKQGVSVIGNIPAGLPQLTWPEISLDLIEQLWISALSIAVIGYVESVSVGKTLAAKQRQKIDNNKELIGLGVANIASAFSGAFPVTGGLSRTVVNYDAGAVTQAAGIYAAIGIALASLYLAPAMYYLPKATLAATIIIAVLALLDFSILKKTWNFSKSDFLAVVSTIFGTLLLGVEAGVAFGVLLSLLLFLYRSSIPHIAEVGLIEGTQHFRNIKRFHVTTYPEILNLRVDESLFFANATCLEDCIYQRLYDDDRISHVVLICSAINEIDFTAMEVLYAVNDRLLEQGVMLHLSEVKGPVIDSLRFSGFLENLSGRVYLSQFAAFESLITCINPESPCLNNGGNHGA